MPNQPQLDLPVSFVLSLADKRVMSNYDQQIVRRLSSMRGYYVDSAAFEDLLAEDDPVLYEVYQLERPAISGELTSGVTILRPGKVGQEYFMTKGHFHTVLETGEVYYALAGTGMMVMETPEGESCVKSLKAGEVVYVPPRWAHRTVNVGSDELRFFWVYPAHAGHDYGTIERQGFRKIVVESASAPTVLDNPRWSLR